MPTRFSLLFQLATSPSVKLDATVHLAGWSESFWQAGNVSINDASVVNLVTKRNLVLPKQGTIIGYRIASYTAIGNKMTPQGTSQGKYGLGGNAAWECDVPGMALMFYGRSAGRNTSKFNIAGIPDNQVSDGEYQPTTAFKAQITQYINAILGGGWAFLGRDLTQPAQQVLSINGAVVTLRNDAGGVANQDFLIFNRTRDDAGHAVKGSFLITAHAGASYTLAGLAGHNLTKPSGTARVDKPAVTPFTEIHPNRVKVRKVGRPFEQYRGRVSKR